MDNNYRQHTLKSKAYGSGTNTPKPKHTNIEKGSMTKLFKIYSCRGGSMNGETLDLFFLFFIQKMQTRWMKCIRINMLWFWKGKSI